VERLEMVLRLTRELGVNLAGVEVILSCARRWSKCSAEMEEAIIELRGELEREIARREEARNALVPVRRITVKRGE